MVLNCNVAFCISDIYFQNTILFMALSISKKSRSARSHVWWVERLATDSNFDVSPRKSDEWEESLMNLTNGLALRITNRLKKNHAVLLLTPFSQFERNTNRRTRLNAPNLAANNQRLAHWNSLEKKIKHAHSAVSFECDRVALS